MNVKVAYIFPNIGEPRYEQCARRFSIQYAKYNSGHPHDLYVVVNGRKQFSPLHQKLFQPLSPNFIPHNNTAKDLGGFLMMANRVPCDLLVCLGAPTRPRIDGWLNIMVQAVRDYGPGLYGCWAFHAPAPHIRTTCFWCPPEILTSYPHPVLNDRDRYRCEHSHESITMFAKHNGLPIMMVTTKGVFPIDKWHHVPQSECLMLDQHTDRIHYHDSGSGWG